LRKLIVEATAAFERYDHTRALELAETFFWNFTDDYLELVKERAYGQGGYSEIQIASAVITLRHSLGVLVRLFAPFLPFAAEEVWSWWQDGSVHRAAWPTTDDLPEAGHHDLMPHVAATLIAIRKSKSDRQLSMKAEISKMVIGSAQAELLALVSDDLKAVGRISQLEFSPGETTTVLEVEFKEIAE